MKCEDVQTHAMDLLSGTLEPFLEREVRHHLEGCAGCRAELEGLADTWLQLGLVADELPSERLAVSFRRRLAGEIAARRHSDPKSPGWLPRLLAAWSRQPALGLATSLLMLVLGLAAGLALPRAGAGGGEIARLEEQVVSLNRLVAMSLLDRPSASDRLRGVSLGRDAARGDQRVVAALLEVVSHDPSVNVRLAAIDALGDLASVPAVRGELIAALPRQGSPLVQLALANLLLEADGEEARQAVRRLLADPDLNPTVRERLERRLA